MNQGIERYLAPQSLDEALFALQELGEVTLLAGGTDLMPQAKAGRAKFKRTLMNLRGITELKGVTREGDLLRLGSLTTITELLRDPLVAEHLPVLREACDHFASDQIRNAATLGGNISNASPAGDTLVPLMALDAEVELASRPDEAIYRRRMPLSEFFVGPGKTRRAPAELVSAVLVPCPPSGHVARFYKFGTRPALDISAISIALAGVRENGHIAQVRIALGAVAPTPLRALAAEEALEGRPLNAQTIALAAATARAEIQPIDDLRASAWYRQELVHNMLTRMLEHVAQN